MVNSPASKIQPSMNFSLNRHRRLRPLSRLSAVGWWEILCFTTARLSLSNLSVPLYVYFSWQWHIADFEHQLLTFIRQTVVDEISDNAGGLSNGVIQQRPSYGICAI